MPDSELHDNPKRDAVAAAAPSPEAPSAEADPLIAVQAAIGRVREDLMVYLRAAATGAQIAVRDAIIRVVWMVVIAFAAFVATAAGIVLTLIGLANSISALSNSSAWLGYTTVGIAATVGPALLYIARVRAMKRRSLQKTKAAFEQHAGQKAI